MFTMQVWLKHDLRLDDHPGLIRASQHASAIVPTFCMDPKLYVHLQRTPNGISGRQIVGGPEMSHLLAEPVCSPGLEHQQHLSEYQSHACRISRMGDSVSNFGLNAYSRHLQRWLARKYRVENDASTGLLGSLSALRESLIEKGSNLVVRCGVLPEVLRKLVAESGAEEIIAEEEVEYRSVYAFFVPFYNGLLWHLTGGITCLHSNYPQEPLTTLQGSLWWHQHQRLLVCIGVEFVANPAHSASMI